LLGSRIQQGYIRIPIANEFDLRIIPTIVEALETALLHLAGIKAQNRDLVFAGFAIVETTSS
jgi:hypothetical protein